MTEAKKIEIEGIKEATRKELKEIEIERINEMQELERIARQIKFYSNVNLRRESNKTILSVAEYVSNRKKLKIKPVDWVWWLKFKCRAYFPELPFGIISHCTYLSIRAMSIISSDTKITKKFSLIPEEMI